MNNRLSESLSLVPAAMLALALAGTMARAESLPAVDTNRLTRAGERIELPGMTIHGGPEKAVELGGKIALTAGILEFGSVEPQGRDYESLLIINGAPSALQYALLLIGCEPGVLPRLAKPGEPVAERLAITVGWERDGKAKSFPLEQLLVERRTGQPPAAVEWYFTGSYFSTSVAGRGEVFMSDVEEAHIALWWNRAVMINIGGEYGNPYNDDEQGFGVNEDRVPPRDTPVRVTIRKVGDQN